MVQDDDGAWHHGEWVERCEKAGAAYQELAHRWNKYVALLNNMLRPRNVGGPLAASAAQVAQVRKLHKAGHSLRDIAEDTSLGLQTVRTIVDQGNGRDRTTVEHLQRIDPARFSEEPWRARTRAALPKRITATLAQARELVKAAKGLK